MRFVTFFPLDVAADARTLVCGNRTPEQHCFRRAHEVTARNCVFIAGTTFVELASVDQFLVTIKKVEVRRTSRLIGFRNGLCRIVEVGKVIFPGGLFHPHEFGVVVRIVLYVV